MKRIFCILVCCFSFVFSWALEGHPEGDCGFRTKWGDFVNMFGDVRVVGPNETADLYVRIYQKGDTILSGTPEIMVSFVEGVPDWCGEFRIVESGEDYTIRFVESGKCADIIFILGDPRKSYRQGTAFFY